MKMMPKTRLGKWSLRLLAGFFILIIFNTVVVIGLFKQEGGKTLADNLYISIPVLSAFCLAIAAFITGVISYFKYMERSLLIYLPIIFGFLFILFIIGETTVPN